MSKAFCWHSVKVCEASIPFGQGILLMLYGRGEELTHAYVLSSVLLLLENSRTSSCFAG